MSGRYSKLTLAQVATYPRPGMAIPAAIGFTPDSRKVTYLASAEGSLVRSLWTFDPDTKEHRVLAGPEGASSEREFSREEQLRRERLRLREVGVTSYSYAKDAPEPVLMVPSPSAIRILRGGSWVELEGTAGALDSQLSRDGEHVLFVRDGELWTTRTRTAQRPLQLTSGAEDGLTNGAAEFIAAEELGRSLGAWWSRDGERIAYIQADSRHIPDYPIVHQGSDRPEVEHHRYPFSGDRNAVLRLGIIARGGGETLWLPTAAEEDAYIARVAWRPSGMLAVEVLSRDQRDLEVLEFDSEGRKSVLRREHGEPWYNLSDDTRYLESGEVLFSSERTGFRHLYLRSGDGEERALTEGEWMVTRLVDLDEQARVAWFEATREGPLERHVYRLSLESRDITRLTSEPGFHSAVLSPDYRCHVEVYNSRETAPIVRLRSMDGSRDVTVFDNGGTTAASLGLQAPEFLEVPADDGTTLYGALYTPHGSEAGAKLPLIVSVYGGPHAQMVVDAWSLTVDLRAQYLAQNGYVVLKLDNRGSAARGIAFEAELASRFGTVEVEDQVRGVEALVQRGLIDPARVGIYGWSYGGYMTAMAMLRRPELFKVGVAGAPVADWDGYDTGYTERYMGRPQSNPDGYRDGSLLTHASKLSGKLLLVHGGVDENVHFRHTARFIVALTSAQKPYDALLFPEERHMPRDSAGLEYMEWRLVDYFNEHL